MAVLMVLLLVSAVAFAWVGSRPITAANLSDAPAPSASDTPIGVPPYGASNDAASYDHQRAVLLYKQYPQFYQCNKPQSLNDLHMSTLVPNTNVLATIAYDPNKGKYVTGGDPRIAFSIKETVMPADGDSPVAYRRQTITWTYAGGIEPFATYEQYRNSAPGNPWAWSQYSAYDKYLNGYRLYAYPDNGKAHPVYLVLAMNSAAGCNAPNLTAYGFVWSEIAKTGFNAPEAFLD